MFNALLDAAPLCFAAAAAAIFALHLSMAPEASAEPVTVAESPAGPNNPRNTETAFATLDDGRILLVYTHFTGKVAGDHELGQLVARTSSDDGWTWSPERPLFDRGGQMNDMSPSLLHLSDGRLALFYMGKNALDDCLVKMRTSDDQGQTWSAPTDCLPGESGYFVTNNDRVIRLTTGRIVLPTSKHTDDQGDWVLSGTTMCFYSDDDGNTWQRGKDRLIGQDPAGEPYVLQEPGVVELSDGRVMLWARTDRGHQVVAVSEDGAETFSPLKPWNLRSPRSPASVKRIPSTGDLLAVWNDSHDPADRMQGPRTPLRTAISRDEGKTWQPPRDIEADPKGFYCYTGIHFVGDRVLLGYWRMMPGTGHGTRVVSVPVDWFYHRQA